MLRCITAVSLSHQHQVMYLLIRCNPEPTGNAVGSNITVKTEIDTVDSASPYAFNLSLRSVWGMNGMHADGSKATGFKSMVVAQFTGLSLHRKMIEHSLDITHQLVIMM